MPILIMYIVLPIVFFNSTNSHLPPRKYSHSFPDKPSWKYYAGTKRIPPPPPQLPVFPPPPQIKREMVNIQVEIESLDDLLKLISDYPLSIDKEYNINMAAIHKIEEPLNDLNKMIGMHNLKNSIVDQILYFVQNLHKDKLNKNGDFMHTVIYGPSRYRKNRSCKNYGKNI